jgi:hypothetical protein
MAIHLLAGIIGELDSLLSMIASRPPSAAARRAVIDQSDPLAILAAVK